MGEGPAVADTPPLAGRYELGAVLGTGGMAEVYRAEDLKLSRPVAVKVLRDTAGDESDRARFIDEARTLAMLSHSGLVMVLDAGFGAHGRSVATAAPGDDQPFLVMELVEGPTLAQVIAGGPVPLDEVGAIGAQVAEALAYVHARGVVHRDVKPGNVLIGPANRVKLADFGIARLVAHAARHTRTGHAIGTAAYLAPEQVRGEDVAGGADVYSLGLVLLEAITGRREYPGVATEAAVARLHRSPEVPDDLPPRWRDLLLAMTVLAADGRPSAGEVASTLREGLASPAPTGTAGVPDAETAPILAVRDSQTTRPLTGPPVELPAPPGGPPPSSPPPSSPPPSSPPPSSPPPSSPPPSSPPPSSPPPSSPPPSSLPPSSPPPVPEPADARRRSISTRVRGLAGRARAVPTHIRGVVAAVAVLLLLLVVVAVASGDGGGDDLPDGTPPELRGPMEELREAVMGEE